MTGERQPLRLGLVLDRSGIARYALEIVRQLRASPFARIECVARDGRDRPLAGWAFRAYAGVDQRLAGVTDDPLDLLEGRAELAGVQEKPLGDLKVGEVDLVLDLRQHGAADTTGDAPRLGWWWLQHGARGPGGFWEIVTSDPLTEVSLHVRRVEGTVALGHAVTATKTGISWARNRLAPYREAVTLVVQTLRQVHAQGLPPAAAATLRTASTAPASLEVMQWLTRAVSTKIARRLTRRQMVPVWQMAIRDTTRGLLDRGPGDRVDGYRWLRAPAGRQYADPFLVKHGEHTWCFFEDINVATGRGRIAAAEVTGGELKPAVAVLDRPYHLSYPCVFREGDALFMIPESSESGAIELYRCVSFPGEWTLERVLLQQTAVDSTICRRDGLYWLFATHLDDRSQATQLWLYSGESLAGPWRPHPQNPLSMDVRNARGAGAIVEHGGRWYRPSQDCSIRYGRTFSLNEIVTLTPERYEERPVVTIEPMPGFACTHSYARSGSIEMIDGCVLVPASS